MSNDLNTTAHDQNDTPNPDSPCECGQPGLEVQDHDSNCILVLCPACIQWNLDNGVSRELPRVAGRRTFSSAE